MHFTDPHNRQLFKDVCRTICIFLTIRVMKTLNKCSRSAQFCSVIMHICISDITTVFEFTHVGWLHHHSELGVDSGILLFWVGWFRRKKHVKFRHHQTSYHYHVLSAVNTKSNTLFISQVTKHNCIQPAIHAPN